MAWLVAPVDQRLSLGLLDVKVTLSLEQKIAGPLLEIVGSEGEGLTTTEIAFEGAEMQSPLLTTTV